MTLLGPLFEREWIYAARAGSTTQYSFGDSEAQLGDYAWCAKNSSNKPQRTAQKLSNAFGLFDIHGNVWDQVEDCWHGNYSGAPTDGSDWITGCTGANRGHRGGSWGNGPWDLRSAISYGDYPVVRYSTIGFRVARLFNYLLHFYCFTPLGVWGR